MTSESVDINVELHQRTKDVHDASNKLTNVKLMVALTDTRIYGSVLKDFFFVYRAIEDALEACRDEEYVFPLRDPRMYRSAQLEKDVIFFLGSDNWSAKEEPSPAAKKYLDRIEYVATTKPSLLVAYAHTMFLAPLAGGPIIGAIVKRTLGLNDEGLAFFDFGDVDTKTLRAEFKEKINGMKIEGDFKEKIIEEKKLVFKMNNEIASQVTLSLSSFQRLSKILLLLILVSAVFIFIVRIIL